MLRDIPASVLAITLLSAGPGAHSVPATTAPSDAEIHKVLAERVGSRQSVGIVVGVIEPGARRVVAEGVLAKGDRRPLNGDTIFEIGSVTKVFTSLLLSDMALHGEVALTDPVTRYLPPGFTLPERGGSEGLFLQSRGRPDHVRNRR